MRSAWAALALTATTLAPPPPSVDKVFLSIMRAWQGRQRSWDMDGLSLHNYTVVKWPPAYKSIGFGEAEYALTDKDRRSEKPRCARES